MIKIMFVCHGNICRSPMAEYVLTDLVNKKGISGNFLIRSCATSTEEIGNDVHYGTKGKLLEMGIDCPKRKAIQLTKNDYDNYDYFLCMDSYNVRNAMKIFDEDNGHKVHRLMDFTGNSRDIADPWYTGNFDDTFNDILKACTEIGRASCRERVVR